MKQLLFLASMSASMICYGQVAVDDYSQSGGISQDTTITERYDVNHIEYLPYLTLNGSALIGYDVLEIGKTYTFTIEFTNTLNRDIIIGNCIMDCECIVPSWDKNTIAPGGKRTITFKFHASTSGDIKAKFKIQLLDPLGTMPAGVQEGELLFKVG